MTSFFDVKNFSMRPILVFAVVLALFGCYVIQIHYLCNHHRVERALRLMFSHYFIVIAVNLITVAFKFLENPEADRLFTVGLMTTGIVLFFIALYANRAYYHKRHSFLLDDGILSGVFVILGAILMFVLRENIYGFLLGVLIAASGNFAIFVRKHKMGYA